MKNLRQNKIIELIENNSIKTQEELTEKLCVAGFDVTQATVSRDIRELKLTKTASNNGERKYTISKKLDELDVLDSRKVIDVFRKTVKSIDYAGNIIVIKTLQGMGMAVGVAVDSMKKQEVLGCVAGDDAVFCLVKTQEQAVLLMEDLKKIIWSNESV